MNAALLGSLLLATTITMVGCTGGGANDDASASAMTAESAVVYAQPGQDLFPMMNAVVEQTSPSGLDVKLYDIKVARGSGWGERLYLGVVQAGVENLFSLDQIVDQTPTLSFTNDPNQIQLTADSYSASFEVNGGTGTLTVEGVDTTIAAQAEPDVGDLTVIGGETSLAIDAATTAHLFTMKSAGDTPNHYWLLLSLFDGVDGLSFPLQIDLSSLDKVAKSDHGNGLTFSGTVNFGAGAELVAYDVQINDGATKTVTVTKQ